MIAGAEAPRSRCPAPTAMASLMAMKTTAIATPATVRAGRFRRCDSGRWCGASGGGVGAEPYDEKVVGGVVGAVGGVGALTVVASSGDPVVSVTCAA